MQQPHEKAQNMLVKQAIEKQPYPQFGCAPL